MFGTVTKQHRSYGSSATIWATHAVIALIGLAVLVLGVRPLFGEGETLPTMLYLVVVALLAASAAQASARMVAYRDGFDALAQLSHATTLAADTTVALDALLAAVRQVGGIRSCAVAEIGPRDAISWLGHPGLALRSAFTTREGIEAVAARGPTKIRSTSVQSAGAWPLDEHGGRFLVATAPRRDVANNDLWVLVAQMAIQGSTAISAVHHTAELARRSKEDHRRARTDEITHLPNRFAAREFLTSYLENPKAASLSLITASVNGLQSVHDVLGEAFSNQALIDFSKEITEIDGTLFVGVLDRDQFLVVVEGERDVSMPIANALANYQSPEISLRTRDASVGILLHPTSTAISADSLLNHARWALERAQASGEVEVFSEASALDQNRRLAMQMNLPTAIAENKIVPVFQPQIRLRDNKLVGVESLARWNDNALGSVSPSEFIPIAENALHIEALTKSIVAQSASALQRWRARGLAIDVSINVSGTSLNRGEFVEYLNEVIGFYDKPESRLAVEITESSLVSTEDATLAALQLLHDSGAKLSIDDFGTGYSSLSYLKDLPADVIKIDSSMVKDLRVSPDQVHIVAGIIAIGHALGFEILAEGIEDGETLRMLTEMGCDIGQGFYIGYPMSQADLDGWIERRQRRNCFEATPAVSAGPTSSL